MTTLEDDVNGDKCSKIIIKNKEEKMEGVVK
jgi:hypothetical protein